MDHSVYPRCTQHAIMEANAMQETALLEMRGICKFFPGVRALDGVDFTLRRGEIHALMGENGAGKSTLIKVLTGVYPEDEGSISMEVRRPYRSARRRTRSRSASARFIRRSPSARI